MGVVCMGVDPGLGIGGRCSSKWQGVSKRTVGHGGGSRLK